MKQKNKKIKEGKKKTIKRMKKIKKTIIKKNG